MKSHGICLSLIGLFHLTLCSPGPSILLQRAKFCSFLWPSKIPMCKCPIVVLSTHLLMDTWATSYLFFSCPTFYFLFIKKIFLLFFQIRVLGSFGYNPRSGIAGAKGRSTFNFFELCPYCFPQWLHQSAFPPTVHKGSPFSTSSPALIC